jgi:hypothetical protein
MRALTEEEEAQFQAIVRSPVPPVFPTNASSDSVQPGAARETMVEFVLRVMSAYGFGFENKSEAGRGSVRSANVRNMDKHENAPAKRESDELHTKAA